MKEITNQEKKESKDVWVDSFFQMKKEEQIPAMKEFFSKLSTKDPNLVLVLNSIFKIGKKDFLTLLPKECSLRIADYYGEIEEIFKVFSLVSKNWRNLIESSWMHWHEKRYGESHNLVFREAFFRKMEAINKITKELEVEIIDRPNLDGANFITFIRYKDPFSGNGEIKSVKFFAKRISDLDIQVWRKSESFQDCYELKQTRKLKSFKKGINIVPMDEPLSFKKGDFFGFKFGKYSSIPFSRGNKGICWNDYPKSKECEIGHLDKFAQSDTRTYSIYPICGFEQPKTQKKKKEIQKIEKKEDPNKEKILSMDSMIENEGFTEFSPNQFFDNMAKQCPHLVFDENFQINLTKEADDSF